MSAVTIHAAAPELRVPDKYEEVAMSAVTIHAAADFPSNASVWIEKSQCRQ